MWSGPRNLSTAMMRSFGSRADAVVSDEPYYGAYLKHTGDDHPMAAEVIAAMTKIHQCTILCAPITGQIAAQEAIKNGFKETQIMKREYARRRRYIVDALNSIGLSCHMPEGAFYAFPSIKKTGENSMDFAKNLLAEQKVALVPGVAFGKSCEGYVRISYASSYENLKEAIARMKMYLKK